MDMKLILDVLKKHVDEKGLIKDLAMVVLLPLVEKFAADSKNPYDDKLVEWFKSFVEKELAK
jgi:hypothetical protein